MARRSGRRSFLLGAAAAAVTLGASTRIGRAEAPARRRWPRLGLLLYGFPGPPAPAERAMLEQLDAAGWAEGRSVNIERRYAEGSDERMAGAVQSLLAASPEVIVAFGMDLAKAARAATRTVPIVMTGSEDPVKSGLVGSLARPGGNVTGSTFMSPQLAGKRLELLRETVPRMQRTAVLLDPTHVDDYLAQLEGPARALGVQLHVLEIHGAADVNRVMTGAARAGADALFIVPARVTVFHQRRLAEMAVEQRLPAMSAYSDFARAGGLLSYGADTVDMARRVTAAQVDRILRGARAADVPVEQPTRFELVVNARAAKAMALALPPTLLARADQVIE